MNRKVEMFENLLLSYDKMMNDVSSEELAKSGLFVSWTQQASVALLTSNMEMERQVWDEVRKLQVSFHERAALEAYGTGMKAILIGMLCSVEQESDQ